MCAPAIFNEILDIFKDKNRQIEPILTLYFVIVLYTLM